MRPCSGPQLDVEGLAAAAGAGDVRVVEDELRGELRLLEVHLRAEERQLRLLVDEDGDAVLGDDLLLLGRLEGEGEGVGEAVAPALPHADPEAEGAGLAGRQLADPGLQLLRWPGVHS